MEPDVKTDEGTKKLTPEEIQAQKDKLIADSVQRAFQSTDIKATVETTVDRMLKDNPTDPMPKAPILTMPTLKLDIERSAGGVGIPRIRVGDPREKKDIDLTRSYTAHMLQALAKGNHDDYQRAQKQMLDYGMYDQHLERGYTTLVDDQGGVFLPTLIVQEIQHQRPVYGVVDQYALRVPINSLGQYVYPKMTGSIDFVATGEGQAVTFSQTVLGAVVLTPKKWSGGTTWTREMDMLAANTLIPVLNQKIADGLAYVKDNALFNGDGSAAFNRIKGLTDASRTGVGKLTLASGKDTFAEATWEDYRQAPTFIHTSSGPRAIWVFHPHSPPILLDGLKDGNDNPIYRGPTDATRPGTFYGAPYALSEVINGPATASQASKPFAFHGDFSQCMLGDYMGISVRILDQGSITDHDATVINLGTQQYLAMIVNAYFDLVPTFENAFMQMVTAAS